jgi:hypothetical protein
MEEETKEERRVDTNAFLASYTVGSSVFLFMVSRSPILSKLDGNILIISTILFLSLPILLFVMFNKVKTK